MLRLPLLVFFAVLLLQFAAPLGGLSAATCDGKYKGGLTPSSEELWALSVRHEEWLSKPVPRDTRDPNRANLCEANLAGKRFKGADLRGVNFAGADLEGALLSGAHLEGADLTHASLRAANLVGAYLGDANLPQAGLDFAILSGADLREANLSDASLASADLRGANLSGATVTGAKFADAKLDGADFAGANVEGAHFDLLPDSLPDLVGLSSAVGLQFVEFSGEPAGLAKLKNDFKRLGLGNRTQITCAIRRYELRRTSEDGVPLNGALERWENYVLFDITCRYGASPARPLLIVAFFSILFSVIYVFAQISPGQRGGIWVVWDEQRIDKTEGSHTPQRLIAGFPSNRQRGRVRQSFSILLLAAYFSVVSALGRVVWQGLSGTHWITLMQPREYSLRGSGCVRLVSGLQCFISVSLVALTILTYFGTPFEY